MHWILQNNLFNEAAYQVLLETLERFDIPHSIHKVIPFIGELTEPEAPTLTGPVICMGSYSLRHAAKKHGWYPGVFDLEPLNFQIQLKHWGDELLNADSEILAFKDVKFPMNTEQMFIRPIEDSKVFTGKIFKRADFEDWQRKVVVLEEDYGNSLTKDTLVQITHPKIIYSEYRFWIVHGEIICASLYKRGDKVLYSSNVDECFFTYVRARLAEWNPHAAFVIDVCDSENGIKIVEINTLNSCGFYAADIPKLVMALEEGFGERL